MIRACNAAIPAASTVPIQLDCLHFDLILRRDYEQSAVYHL